VGDVVKNNGSSSTATVTAVDSPTQLSLSGNIFTTRNVYAVLSGETSLTRVIENPTSGEYAITIDESNRRRNYTFNVAQHGQLVKASFSYTPFVMKKKIQKQKNSVKVRNPAGKYYWRLQACTSKAGCGAFSKMVSATDSGDEASNPLRIGDTGTMQKNTADTIEVTH